MHNFLQPTPGSGWQLNSKLQVAAFDQSIVGYNPDPLWFDHQGYPRYPSPAPQRSCETAFYGPLMLCDACHGSGVLAVDPTMLQPGPATTSTSSLSPPAVMAPPAPDDNREDNTLWSGYINDEVPLAWTGVGASLLVVCTVSIDRGSYISHFPLGASSRWDFATCPCATWPCDTVPCNCGGGAKVKSKTFVNYKNYTRSTL